MFRSFVALKDYKICLFIIAGLLSGCSTTPSGQESHLVPLSADHQQLKDDILHVYNQWQGTPYRLGGTSPTGIDCSAFVQVAYLGATNIVLPRTTKQQVQLGQEVEYWQANVGDLIFFKTSRTARHVGVYIGQKQFVHASTSKGVIISRIDNPYWAGNFWQFRRVINSPIHN